MYKFHETTTATSLNYESMSISVGYLFSVSYVKQLGGPWILLSSLDYGYGKKVETFGAVRAVNSLALNVGIGVRF